MIEKVRKWMEEHELCCGTNGGCCDPIKTYSPVNETPSFTCKHKHKCNTINEVAFKKFENVHKGETAILYACGPSLNNYKAIDGSEKFIHAGVNGILKQHDLAKKLHYYFYGDAISTGSDDKHSDKYGGCDYLDIAKGYEPKNAKFIHSYRGGPHHLDASKLCGVHHYAHIEPIKAIKHNAIPYEDCLHLSTITSIPGFEKSSSNIMNHPVKGGGIVFRAIQILLFMGISRLYIVGNDMSKIGIRFYDIHSPSPFGVGLTNTKSTKSKPWSDEAYKNWTEFASYLSKKHPDAEIISVNPVYLKGIFKDKFQ